VTGEIFFGQQVSMHKFEAGWVPSSHANSLTLLDNKLI